MPVIQEMNESGAGQRVTWSVMNTLQRLLLFALFGPAAAAEAQGFNLDTGTATTAPPVSYGGAAMQPGFWNNDVGQDSMPFPLLDLSGHTSSVTFSMNLPFGPAQYPHAGLNRGDALLLDDYFDLHSTRADFTISGLAEGHYSVFTYAWAADNPNVQMSVDVNGVGVQLIGGGWPGSQMLGVTYAQHEVDLMKDEALDIFIRGLPSNGTLNGLQLVFRAGFADAGPDDAGGLDAAEADAMDPDASDSDAGALDAAEAADAGEIADAGATPADAAIGDAGIEVDAGHAADAASAVDAGLRPDASASAPDAGTVDAGSGCGCQTSARGSALELGPLAMLALLGRRRRSRSA